MFLLQGQVLHGEELFLRHIYLVSIVLFFVSRLRYTVGVSLERMWNKDKNRVRKDCLAPDTKMSSSMGSRSCLLV